MKKTAVFLLTLCVLFTALLASCGKSTPTDVPQTGEFGPEDIPALDTEKTEIPAKPADGVNTLSVVCTEGTDGCWKIDGKTVTFTGLAADTVCTLSGEFDGNIVIDAGENAGLELELCGLTLWSDTDCPITVLSGDKVTLTAKKDTQNFIYDTRAAVTDEAAVKAAVYADCDLDVGGKGELTVISAENNGIHSKDDLEIKNLTLSVTCADNALKGNDSVTVSGGILTLAARTGDAIKTTSSDISSKGKQRGNVTLAGCRADIYAAGDGIDAVYDAEIGEDTVLNIYTDRYSPYAAAAAGGEEPFAPVPGQNEGAFPDGGMDFGGPGGREIPGGQGGFGGRGMPGGQSDFGGRGGTGNPGGQRGGPGGMTDGNTNKSDGSAKGIKAGNAVTVSGGNITIRAYDDAIHANRDTAPENGASPLGSVTVNGGTLSLYSDDDAIHADGVLTVNGGKVDIQNCYEGLEGDTVVIAGGDISVISRDDGVNATATSGTGIAVRGGTLYIYAGGDGMDANSRSSYQGILFAGGDVTVISTSGGNSSIDTEQGYEYTGGRVLALCPANGMGSESTRCRNFNSVATKTTMSLRSGETLSVSVNGKTEASVEMPCALSALVIYLGASGATFSAE